MHKVNRWLSKHSSSTFNCSDWNDDSRRYDASVKCAPSPVICNDTYAIIVPIQPNWAKRLFSYGGEQGELFAVKSSAFLNSK